MSYENHSLHLYKSGKDDLLVFSETSGRLYGFDKVGASIFFFLESEKASKEELLHAVGNNETARSIIYTIDNLLKGREEPESVQTDLQYRFPLTPSKITHSSPLYYQLDNFTFVIDTDEELIRERIIPAFSHLRHKQSLPVTFDVHIEFVQEGKRWSICFNGKALKQGLVIDELLPMLVNFVRVAYYRSFDYLISLHAAALYYNKIPLILPAASGSGKSTLSTYLMEKSFEFLSDDAIAIDKNARLRPIPLSIAIKEGSWSVLEKNGVFMTELPVHKRFDGQNVRFLIPNNIATEVLSVENAYLVFPRYVAGASTIIKSISTLEALSIIIHSRYEVQDSYDETIIRQWIGLVEKMNKYSITYSDMEDARNHLEKLMSA